MAMAVNAADELKKDPAHREGNTLTPSAVENMSTEIWIDCTEFVWCAGRWAEKRPHRSDSRRHRVAPQPSSAEHPKNLFDDASAGQRFGRQTNRKTKHRSASIEFFTEDLG